MAQNWIQGSGVYTLTEQLQEAGSNNWPPNQIPNTYPPYTTFTQGLGSFGQNNYGQLGQGDVAYRSSPVQIGQQTDWYVVSVGGAFSAVIKTNGTLWSFGRNNLGQLGTIDVVYKSSPVQVGTNTNWLYARSGLHHTISTDTSRALWAWGWNQYGQLGNRTILSRSSPTQVGALTDWNNMAGGTAHTLATKTDGTLWAWGRNNYGQLGLSIASTISRSSPVQVGSLTTWLNISAGQYFSLATKTDGTLWAWGRNDSGQLGLNIASAANRSSPVQVGTQTDWSKITCGQSHALAIKTNGTLWSWGYNFDGQLGQSDQISRSSPVQVGALTNWSNVNGGQLHTIANKTDGTFWAWGNNFSGQLGQNNNSVYKSSPVQVGSLTTWVQQFCGPLSNSSYALLSQV